MENVFTIILSSTVITAIITTILTFITNRRKDTVENIIKERKVWRDELRTISSQISKSRNLKELKIAISKLKVRVNPYGLAVKLIFYDSNIWELINNLEKNNQISKKDLENYKVLFINQISCLLKYDWERSKNEIKGNIQAKLVIISLIVSFLLYSFRWYNYYGVNRESLEFYISYCVIYSVFVAFSLIIINIVDNWISKRQLISRILLVVMLIVMIFHLWHMLSFKLLSSKIDAIIFFSPFITLLYCSEDKYLTYKRNMGKYILTSMLSCGLTKVDKKYRVFFDKHDKRAFGDTVSFE